MLDADFVKGARRRELSARERRDRAERARAERDRAASIARNDRRNHRINRRAIRAIRQGRLRSALTVQTLQPASSAPVTYDPCRPISVVVNTRTAPSEGARLVDEALREVGARAGLEFRNEGVVTEAPVDARRSFQPETYGDRWAPVLIAWSDPVESQRLVDRVAGLGGSAALPISESERVYVTGTVTLDGPQLAEILQRKHGFDEARAVLLHELGHLIGLAHVDDASQLMHDKNSARLTTFGVGDLSGIAALRDNARCHPTL